MGARDGEGRGASKDVRGQDCVDRRGGHTGLCRSYCPQALSGVTFLRAGSSAAPDISPFMPTPGGVIQLQVPGRRVRRCSFATNSLGSPTEECSVRAPPPLPPSPRTQRSRATGWSCPCATSWPLSRSRTRVDRLTFNGTIVETGTDDYRLASTRARAETPAKAG